MEHIHDIYDDDSCFILDPDSRTITLSDGDLLIMQDDHNSEQLTFMIPRYIEGHDMFECNLVQIHWVNSGTRSGSSTRESRPGIYKVKDLAISPDDDETLTCTWLIDEQVTQLAGTLSFALKFVCYSDDPSNPTYRLKTRPYTKGTIEQGLDNSEIIVEENPDVIVEFEQRISELEKGSVGNLEPGEGENSIQSTTSRAITNNSISLGDGNVAGVRGYYISAIDFENRKIYLSNTQTVPVSGAGEQISDFESPAYEVGDTFTIINDAHFPLCGVISAVENNAITYGDDLPFTDILFDSDCAYFTAENKYYTGVNLSAIEETTFVIGHGASTSVYLIKTDGPTEVWKHGDVLYDRYGYYAITTGPYYDFSNMFRGYALANKPQPILNIDDYTFCVPSKPDVGVAEWQEGSAALGGKGNSVAGAYGTVGGYFSQVIDDVGTAFGYKCIAAYMAFAAGSEAKALKEQCIALGIGAVAKAVGAIALGIYGSASEHGAAMLGGQGHDVSGQFAVCAGGYYNVASAIYSAVLGGNASQATGEYAAVIASLNSQATALFALVHGDNCFAQYPYAVSIGDHLVAGGEHTFNIGRYNVPESAGDTYLCIGVGTDKDHRKNGLMFYKDGRLYVLSDITGGGDVNVSGDIIAKGGHINVGQNRGVTGDYAGALGANGGAATQPYSLIRGLNCWAEKLFATSWGEGIVADCDYSFNVGKYNAPGYGDNVSVFSVGIGTSDNRKNGLSLDKSGNLKVAGTIKDGSGNALGESVADLAYKHAKDSGYSGTKDDFAKKLAVLITA